MDPQLRRAVLLALNGHPGLSRDAICRLALTVDGWAGGGERPAPAWAAEIGVAPSALAAAAALVATARDRAAAVETHAAAREVQVIVSGDAQYPRALHELALPPPVLFCRGRLPDRPGIAIVGSRAADPYGIEATTFFAGALARSGLAVVSGFARGIDSAAHRAAVRDQDGRTIAVLGCGIDLDYPRGSGRLRREVERQGALVSEFPPGTPALAHNFPIRNRLIAALGVACLVVQAAPRSGSLNTARHALDLGRDVWAVPGRIFDWRSAGAHQLLRDGASPAIDPDHIVESLTLEVKDTLRRAAARSSAERAASAPGGSAAEPDRRSPDGCDRGLDRRVLDLLTTGDAVTAEHLSTRCGASVGRVLAALLDLEIDGRVVRVAGPRFVKRATP